MNIIKSKNFKITTITIIILLILDQIFLKGFYLMCLQSLF